jgi:hypothetical protein
VMCMAHNIKRAMNIKLAFWDIKGFVYPEIGKDEQIQRITGDSMLN